MFDDDQNNIMTSILQSFPSFVFVLVEIELMWLSLIKTNAMQTFICDS